MQTVSKIIIVITIIICSLFCCKKDEYKGLDCSTTLVTYDSTIKVIIDAHCLSSGCHNAGSPNGNYTTYAGIFARVKNGTLAQRVLYTKDMPKNSSLSLEDRKKIKCWIDGGAPEK